MATQPLTHRTVHIVGGGTFSHVRKHLSLAAPAFGTAALRIEELVQEIWPGAETQLHLTKMADPSSTLVTNDDLRELALQFIQEEVEPVVFWTPAVVDFDAKVERRREGFRCGCPIEHFDDEEPRWFEPPELRLSSDRDYRLQLTASDKLVTLFRRESVDGNPPRKGIFLVACKTTAGASEEEMYAVGLKLCKRAAANLVLVNDVVTRVNMVVCPEEAHYDVTSDREAVLRSLVEMAFERSIGDFTPTEVVESETIDVDDPRFFGSLRTVLFHVIDRGGYKPFLGVTSGHFAAKLSDHEFLSSRRKVNYNRLKEVGLVRVVTNGDEKVTAYGAKPSAGGQTQRIIFAEHPEMDCIIHFHCPIRTDSLVPTVSQREHECGSHQCANNTSQGLKSFTTPSGHVILATHADQHGPNIVFNHEIDPQEVIDFIEANFDLTLKTGGFIPSMAYM